MRSRHIVVKWVGRSSHWSGSTVPPPVPSQTTFSRSALALNDLPLGGKRTRDTHRYVFLLHSCNCIDLLSVTKVILPLLVMAKWNLTSTQGFTLNCIVLYLKLYGIMQTNDILLSRPFVPGNASLLRKNIISLSFVMCQCCRFAHLSEAPTEKLERVRLTGDSIIRHVKLARPLGASKYWLGIYWESGCQT